MIIIGRQVVINIYLLSFYYVYKLSEYLYTKLNIIHALYIFVKPFLGTVVLSIYILVTQKLIV